MLCCKDKNRGGNEGGDFDQTRVDQVDYVENFTDKTEVSSSKEKKEESCISGKETANFCSRRSCFLGSLLAGGQMGKAGPHANGECWSLDS